MPKVNPARLLTVLFGVLTIVICGGVALYLPRRAHVSRAVWRCRNCDMFGYVIFLVGARAAVQDMIKDMIKRRTSRVSRLTSSASSRRLRY